MPIQVSLAGNTVTGNLTFSAPVATSLVSSTLAVVTSGTAVVFTATSTPVKYIIVMAKESNTASISIGASNVTTLTGRPLVPLQAERLDTINLNQLYLVGVTSGEGVTFVYAV